MTEAYPLFKRRNVEVVAISTDGIADAIRMADTTGSEYPTLADPEGQVARSYGVYNLLGDGVAAPATFIIWNDGLIFWQHIGQDIADRPSAEELLQRIDGAGL